jgi:cellulose synthase/poly-beta-1,6-N-acetylglucosamine synthase-like glycosyltransferase
MNLLVRFFHSIYRVFRALIRWISQTTVSAIILGVLIFIVVNFYVFSSIVNLNSFFYSFLLLSLLTDGLFILLHLPRRKKTHKRKESFNPSKLTIVIACHNGEDIITETVKGAAMHVPLDQIIIVSDASTDNTAEVAKATGARVIVNPKNLHKVGSINAAMKHVHTPYVLILDDDTLIGKTFIPTSLLDEGYTAVAFNVMPVKHKTLINELQQFEYRSTMQVGKHLRAATGAIGNISGAIGLYRSEDLRRQITMHSGQFAGEDEQRTLLAHMYGEGKGITYTDSLVLTHAPDTYKVLYLQRAFSWCISTPELFMLYWRVILSHRFHYLLKMEKAYLVYIYITEPLRILFLWALFLRPKNLIITYAFYLGLNLLIWLRLGRQDTLRAILLSPLYTLGLTVCRIIGYFYWLKVKTRYLLDKKHKSIIGRWLIAEYVLIFLIILGSWLVSVQHFRSDLNLFNKIRSENLTDNEQAFKYDVNSPLSSLIAATPPSDDVVTVLLEQGDNKRAIAHKAVDKMLIEDPRLHIDDSKRWLVDRQISDHLPALPAFQPNLTIQVARSLITQAIAAQSQGIPQ